MVGTSCRMTIRTMVSMPLRPRSRTRVSPPVLRSRWKRSESMMHVLEGDERKAAHRMHRDLGEEPVAHLREQRHDDAHAAVGDREQHRRREDPDEP